MRCGSDGACRVLRDRRRARATPATRLRCCVGPANDTWGAKLASGFSDLFSRTASEFLLSQPANTNWKSDAFAYEVASESSIARDYDPSVGRWVSKDPSRFGGGLNLYGYCHGDPINRRDPSGHMDMDGAGPGGGWEGYNAGLKQMSAEEQIGVALLLVMGGASVLEDAIFALWAGRAVPAVAAASAGAGTCGGAGPRIQFGNNPNQVEHAFRHIDEMGLDRDAVQEAIEAHLPTVASQLTPGQPLNQIIQVDGQRIQYTAYQLGDGVINVGRIHGVP